MASSEIYGCSRQERTFSTTAAIGGFEPWADEPAAVWNARSPGLFGHVIRFGNDGVTSVLSSTWLSGCATVGSDTAGFGTYPPVVECSRAFPAQAAEELNRSPEVSAAAEMLPHRGVMRGHVHGQAQAHQRR